MESIRGKYDELITALLPLHMKIVKADKNESLIECINKLRSHIGQFNQETDTHLSVLSKMLLSNSNEDLVKHRYVFEGSRTEALSILTKFFFELSPDDYGYQRNCAAN